MGTGRKKIEIKPIESITRRRVTFTKRRQGLFKKMAKLRELTGCAAFALVFSPGGNPYTFGNVDLAESVAKGGGTGGGSSSGGGTVGSGGDVGGGDTSYSGGSEFEFSAELDLLMADGSELPEPSVDRFISPPMAVEDPTALPMSAVQEPMTTQLMAVEDIMPLQAVQEHDLIWDFDEPLPLPKDPEPLPMWAIEELLLMDFDPVDGRPLP